MNRYLVIIDDNGELEELIFEKEKIIKILENESSSETSTRESGRDSKEI
jgi:hypothetical protein